MSFLKEYWDKIQPPKKEMGIINGAVAQGFIRPWNSDLANIHMLKEAISILRPRVIVETGTFEGATTIEMARVVNKYGSLLHVINDKPVKIYTFDGGAPVSCYGDGKSVVDNWERDAQWVAWKAVKEKRDERLSLKFDNCIIKYIEGLTQETLPKTIDEIGEWDLWFQDSVHGLDLIIGEWEVMKKKAKMGSLVIFDDIIAGHGLLDWFPKNNPEWKWEWTNAGRSQLWAEKDEFTR